MNRIRQCPICFENYDETDRIPRILPTCMHSMCSRCLPQLYKSPVFVECPTCRVINHVREKDVPKNRDILEFLEYLKSQSGGSPHATASALPYPPCSAQVHSEVVIPVVSDKSKNSTPHQKHEYEWNEAEYLKGLFDEIDHNHDGLINFQELYEALKKGQSNSKFDQMTVKILLEKYDRNHDNEISFDEFYNLFVGINEQFNEFLDTDWDNSGSIEPNELSGLLAKRRLYFSPAFYQFLFTGVYPRIRSNRITFDIYVRLIARLDNLLFDYNRLSHSQKCSQDFEKFARVNFFNSF